MIRGLRVFSTSKNKRLFRYLDYQMIITHLIRVSSKFQLLVLMNTAMRMGLRVYSSSKSNRLIVSILRLPDDYYTPNSSIF